MKAAFSRWPLAAALGVLAWSQAAGAQTWPTRAIKMVVRFAAGGSVDITGRILSIPYAHDLNDSLEAVSRRTPSQRYCENLIDQFDEMLEESERRPLVMSLVLHSFILGQPHRLRQFRRVIEHILAHRDRIWLTRSGDLCKFIESLPAGVVPGSPGYADRD
jgi:allantoinase